MRVLWGIASQGLNSLSNFLVVLAVAKVGSPETLGSFSLIYATYTFAVTLNRAAVSTPLLLHVDDESDAARVTLVSGGATVSLLWASIMAVPIGVVTLLTPSPPGISVVLAVSLPILLFQDHLRYANLAVRPSRAARMDVVWLTVQIGLLAYIAAAGMGSPTAVVVAWCIGGAASWVVGLWFTDTCTPSYHRMKEYLATYGRESHRLASEALSNAVATNAVPFVVAGGASLGAAGVLRAAQTLFAPLSVIIGGLVPVVLVTGKRLIVAGRSPNWLLVRWITIIATMSALYSLTLIAVPNSWGVRLVGDSWYLAATLLFPLGVQAVMRGFFTGPPVLLRALDRLRTVSRIAWTLVPSSIALPWIGGLVGGAVGAAWGIAAAALVASLVWMEVFRRHAKRIA